MDVMAVGPAQVTRIARHVLAKILMEEVRLRQFRALSLNMFETFSIFR